MTLRSVAVALCAFVAVTAYANQGAVLGVKDKGHKQDLAAIQEHLNVTEMNGILEEVFLEQYPSLPDEIKNWCLVTFLDLMPD